MNIAHLKRIIPPALLLAGGCSMEMETSQDIQLEQPASSDHVEVIEFRVNFYRAKSESEVVADRASMPTTVVVEQVPHTISYSSDDGTRFAVPGSKAFSDRLEVNIAGKSACVTVLALEQSGAEPRAVTMGIAGKGDLDPCSGVAPQNPLDLSAEDPGVTFYEELSCKPKPCHLITVHVHRNSGAD